MTISISNFKNIPPQDFFPNVSIKKVKVIERPGVYDVKVSFDIEQNPRQINNFSLDVALMSGTSTKISKDILKRTKQKVDLSFLTPKKIIQAESINQFCNSIRKIAAKNKTTTPFTDLFKNSDTLQARNVPLSTQELSFSTTDIKNVVLVFFVSTSGSSALATKIVRAPITVSFPIVKDIPAFRIAGTKERESLRQNDLILSNEVAKVEKIVFNKILDFTNIDNSKLINLTPLQRRIKDRSNQPISLGELPLGNNYQIISQLYPSENKDGTINGLFFVNIKNILSRFSSLPSLLDDQEINNFILNNFTFEKIRIIRTLNKASLGFTKSGLKSQKGGEALSNNKYFSVEIPSNLIFDVTNEIVLTNSTLQKRGLKALSFLDRGIQSRDRGRFNYSTTMKFEDPTIQVTRNIYEFLDLSFASLEFLHNFVTDKQLSAGGRNVNLSIERLDTELKKNNLLTINEISSYLIISLKVFKTLSAKEVDLRDFQSDLLSLLIDPDGETLAIFLNNFFLPYLSRFKNLLSLFGIRTSKETTTGKTNSKSNTNINTFIDIQHEFDRTILREDLSGAGFSFFKKTRSSKYVTIAATDVATTALQQLAKIIKINPRDVQDSVSKLQNVFDSITTLKLSDTAVGFYTFEDFGVTNYYVNKFDTLFNNRNLVIQNNIYENYNSFINKQILSILEDSTGTLFKDFSLNDNTDFKLNTKQRNAKTLQNKQLILLLLEKINQQIKFFDNKTLIDIVKAKDITNVGSLTDISNDSSNFADKNKIASLESSKILNLNNKTFSFLLDFYSKNNFNLNSDITYYLNYIRNYNLSYIKRLNHLNSKTVPTHLKALSIGMNIFDVENRKQSSQENYERNLNLYNENFKVKFLIPKQKSPFKDPNSWNTLNSNLLFYKKLVILRDFNLLDDGSVDMNSPIWSLCTLEDLQAQQRGYLTKLEDFYSDRVLCRKEITHQFKTFNEFMIIQ